MKRRLRFALLALLAAPAAAAPSFRCQGLGTRHPKRGSLTEAQCRRLGGKVLRLPANAPQPAAPRRDAPLPPGKTHCRELVNGPNGKGTVDPACLKREKARPQR